MLEELIRQFITESKNYIAREKTTYYNFELFLLDELEKDLNFIFQENELLSQCDIEILKMVIFNLPYFSGMRLAICYRNDLKKYFKKDKDSYGFRIQDAMSILKTIDKRKRLFLEDSFKNTKYQSLTYDNIIELLYFFAINCFDSEIDDFIKKRFSVYNEYHDKYAYSVSRIHVIEYLVNNIDYLLNNLNKENDDIFQETYSYLELLRKSLNGKLEIVSSKDKVLKK